MLTAQEIEDALAPGYELRGLELKGPGSRGDKHLMIKVIRAALGMGNLRDGGHVVVGIDDKNPAALLPGLTPEQLDSWLAYDDVARKMAEYADPPLRFDVASRALSSGAVVAVIQVFEFFDIPHLCARSYEKELRDGALYTRPRKVPETSEVANSVEMRDVLQLATEKALRAYLETAQRAGVNLVVPQPQGEPPAAQLYAQQSEQAWQ